MHVSNGVSKSIKLFIDSKSAFEKLLNKFDALQVGCSLEYFFKLSMCRIKDFNISRFEFQRVLHAYSE